MHTASQALAIERQASAQPSLAERVSRPKTRAILGLMRLNFLSVEAIAQEVGIDEAKGSLLPEDKLRVIGELMARANGAKVGMVGDGINDAPALARSDIAFAMGAAGTDTAIETADIALMDDNLEKIPAFVRLSRATAAILTQNISIALGIKVVFLVLTFTGQATMWMAVFADMGASLLVVFNGLRLLRR